MTDTTKPLDPSTTPDLPGSSIPALFSNRFFVVAGPETTRLVFSEGLGGETINSHTAIVMLTSDAEALGRVLTETIAKNRTITGTVNLTTDPATVTATGTVK